MVGLDGLSLCLIWVHVAMERVSQPSPRSPGRTFTAVFHWKSRCLSGITKRQFSHNLSDPPHLEISVVVEVLES